MLVGFIVLYILISISVGLYAARRVHNATDYVVAGRSLPLYITIATVFATWFGSETVLGTSSTFIEEGLGGIIADPFGASMCLILVGLLFAKPLYRMKLLTIGDFYRRTYGRTVEVLVSLAICVSYLGWVAAQVSALGLVFNVVTQGAVGVDTGMMLGLGIVLLYSLFGGMWSVALTDFIQMIMIMIGLVIVAVTVSATAGGAGVVIDHAVANDKMNFWPEMSTVGILGFIAAWVTMGFGSIPQQDVFQRVMSAKDENTAQRGSIIGGVLYLLFAFIPIFIAYSAFVIDPQAVDTQMQEDSQLVLPNLILNHTPVFVQVMFFGALLSAIMSTASATLLAPSVTFAENIVRGTLPHLNDKQVLKLMRGTVLGFAGIVLFVALNSDLSIFEMVENAYKVTLAGAFVPLLAGVYWKRANTSGAMLSITMGIGIWLICELVAPEGACPPQLAGLVAAFTGMGIGGYFGKQHQHQDK